MEYQSDLEARIAARVREVVPPGTPVTAEVRARVTEVLREFLREELSAVKVPEVIVQALVNMATGSLLITATQKEP